MKNSAACDITVGVNNYHKCLTHKISWADGAHVNCPIYEAEEGQSDGPKTRKNMEPHPDQRQVYDCDRNGVRSFVPNGIVLFLLEFSKSKGIGLNELSLMPFEQEDWDQFYQLIGTTIDSYKECVLVSEEAKERSQ